jgi:CubicO group peptidase (beta-lactamase class C family)
VDFRAFGKKDIASGAPMTKDTIFRLFSMTKVVTGVAMMILYEEGKWQPGEPIADYIPRICAPESLQRGRFEGKNDRRRSRASTNDARADDSHGRFELRVVWRGSRR